MAEKTGMSQSAVSRIWRAFSLQPHRQETFKLSKDPLFVEKVRDVVGLYMSPPTRAVVLCVDEKSQIQALDRPRRCSHGARSRERRSHDYVRHGTTSLFAALDVATGKVIGECHRRHRVRSFAEFLETIEPRVPADLDGAPDPRQSGTHKTPACAGGLRDTPVSAPLHAHERLVAQLGRALVRHSSPETDRRGAHRSTRALETAIREYLAITNEAPKPFVWTKTADEILDSLGRFCPRISASGH